MCLICDVIVVTNVFERLVIGEVGVFERVDVIDAFEILAVIDVIDEFDTLDGINETDALERLDVI